MLDERLCAFTRFACALIANVTLLGLSVTSATAQASPSDTAFVITLGARPASDTSALRAWLAVTEALGARRHVDPASAMDLIAHTRREWMDKGLTAGAADKMLAHVIASIPVRAAIRVRRGGAQAIEAEPLMPPVEISEAFIGASSAPATYAVSAATALTLAAALDTVKQAGFASASLYQPWPASFGEREISENDRSGDGFASEVSEFRDALHAATPQRATILAILDSGWPSAPEKVSSLTLLNALDSTARDVWGIDVEFGDTTDPSPPWAKPNYPHVNAVYASLQNLVPLVNSVSRVYVPLVWPRADSSVLWRVLATAQLVYNQRTRLTHRGGPCAKIQNSDSVVRACLRAPPNRLSTMDAADSAIVSELVSRLTADSVQHAFSESISTSADLFNAVWTLLDSWSFEHDRTTAFISASWTAPPSGSDLPPKSFFNTSIVTVAAAGNADSVFTRSRYEDFLARVWGDAHDFVIVENRRKTSDAMCYSTQLDSLKFGNEDMRVAYFGLVDSLKQCGSSFSAPRVAWTLAVAESLRLPSCQSAAERFRRAMAIDIAAGDGTWWRWPVIYLAAASGENRMPDDPCKMP
jgi:hypothetical protein